MVAYPALLARIRRRGCRGPGYCHCNYGKYCSYGDIKTKTLSLHNLTKEEEATKKASKSKAKARTRAILAKAKAAAARAKGQAKAKGQAAAQAILEEAFEKGQAKAKTKAKANAKTKAGGLDPRMSIMNEDIQSLFDTVQVYRD